MFTESDESADEKPEHPNLVLEGLLNLADEFAKTLPELPDNANRKREQCVERLQIRSDVFDAMIEKARADLPNECCGLLAGHGNLVTASYPLRNQSDTPTHSFVHNQQELLGAYRDIRERGLELIAYYHSHPDAPARPSEGDVEWNPYANLPQVIISISLTTEPPVVKAFRLYKDDFEELPCERTPN